MSDLPPYSPRGHHIAVVGLGMTGLATARVLLDAGARVTLYDTRVAADIDEQALSDAESIPCGRRLGDPSGLEGHELVVTSPGVAVTDPFYARAHAAGVEVVSEVELAYRLFPSTTLVGITGTNGKSTTTALAGAMLSEAGQGVVVGGNIGSPLIADLAGAEASDRRESVFLVELSSFQLEATSHLHLRAAALLNVSDDHADRHPGPGEYLAAKARIFANQNERDFAVLNRDDDNCRRVASALTAPVYWFSHTATSTRAQESGVALRDGAVLFSGGELLCHVGESRLVGRHNEENIMAAALLARLMGACGEDIARALRAFDAAPHTFRLVGEVGGVRYINDSKGTNVAATIRGLEGLGAPVVLIAGGSEKGADFAHLGRALLGRTRGLVLIGQTAESIGASARAAGLEAITRAPSLEQAVAIASTLAEPGDYVVLSPACASFDMFANYKERGRVFEGAVAGLPGFIPAGEA